MSHMKRWSILGGLAFAQAGIVFGYLQLQAVAPSRATAEEKPAPLAVTDAPPLAEPAVPKATGATPPGRVDVTGGLAVQGPQNADASGTSPVMPPPSLSNAPAPSKDLGAAPKSPLPLPAGSPAASLPMPGAPLVPAEARILPLPSAATVPAVSPAAHWSSPGPAPAGATVAAKASSPWKINLAIVDGRTILTAKTGDKVQFKVACDRLDLQAPGGSIVAVGSVSLSSTDLEGKGERLTINLQEDKVTLSGPAHLRASRAGQDLELQADQLSLRIVGGRLSNKPTACR